MTTTTEVTLPDFGRVKEAVTFLTGVAMVTAEKASAYRETISSWFVGTMLALKTTEKFLQECGTKERELKVYLGIKHEKDLPRSAYWSQNKSDCKRYLETAGSLEPVDAKTGQAKALTISAVRKHVRAANAAETNQEMERANPLPLSLREAVKAVLAVAFSAHLLYHKDAEKSPAFDAMVMGLEAKIRQLTEEANLQLIKDRDSMKVEEQAHKEVILPEPAPAPKRGKAA